MFHSQRIILWVMGAWALGGLALMYYVPNAAKTTSYRYFHQLGLELTGRVVGIDVVPVEHDHGVLHVRVSSTNYPYLEPRGRQPYYYCVLRPHHADLLEGGVSSVQVGDSVRVSCASDSIYFYRQGKLDHTRPLFIYTTVSNNVAEHIDL